jgi:hypothetical protein
MKGSNGFDNDANSLEFTNQHVISLIIMRQRVCLKPA